MDQALAITCSQSSILSSKTLTFRLCHTDQMMAHTRPMAFSSKTCANCSTNCDIFFTSPTFSPSGDANQMRLTSSHCSKACTVVSSALPQHGHVASFRMRFSTNKDFTSSSSLHARHATLLHLEGASAYHIPLHTFDFESKILFEYTIFLQPNKINNL